MPSSKFPRDLTRPTLQLFREAIEIPLQARLRLGFNGLMPEADKRGSEEIIDKVEGKCVFSPWQGGAGAVLHSGARGYHVHHWHQHGQRPRILRYLIHQHLRDQDYQGVFACANTENDVNSDQKM